MTWTEVLVVVTIVTLPVYMGIVSAFMYLGKVYAIQILMSDAKKNEGEEKSGKTE